MLRRYVDGPRTVLLAVALPLALFAALGAGAWLGAGLGWESAIADLVERAFPVDSEDIHVDPYMQGVTIAVAAGTAALVVGLLLTRQARAGLFVLAAVGGAVLLNTLVKEVVRRPPIEGPTGDYSFPSGSAAWSMATVAALFLIAGSWRQRRLLLLAGAPFVVALAAFITYEQWHYPSDVLAAWCLALGWVAALWLGPFRRPRAELRRSTA